MVTEEMLFKEFGTTLLTLDQVARLLNRSRDGLRLTIRGVSPLAQQLQGARVKLGRRVHFRAPEIAKILNGEVQT